MKNVWYIYSNQVVSGPYTTENIEKGLEQNKWSIHSLIWWKGQHEWTTIHYWKQNLNGILENLKSSIQKTVWYVEHLGLQKGPMNVNELQQYITQNGLLGSCRVWTTTMDKWTSIFEIPELIEFMKISRRKFPRAPIKGEIEITSQQIQTISSVTTIGEGGFAAKIIEGITPGENYNLIIKSPMLVTPVIAKAKAVYVNPNGHSGMQFENLQPEAKSAIVSYVKQFKT